MDVNSELGLVAMSTRVSLTTATPPTPNTMQSRSFNTLLNLSVIPSKVCIPGDMGIDFGSLNDFSSQSINEGFIQGSMTTLPEDNGQEDLGSITEMFREENRILESMDNQLVNEFMKKV